jgi:hypothetical protein
MKRIIFATLLLFPSVVFAYGILAPISETDLGFSSAQDLSGTPATTSMELDGKEGAFDKLTIEMTVVWGTSVIMNVQCRESTDDSSYKWIQRCSDDAIHNCSPRTWQWEPADGTALALDLSTNYPYLQCTFDDPNDGSGTIVASAIRGR